MTHYGYALPITAAVGGATLLSNQADTSYPEEGVERLKENLPY